MRRQQQQWLQITVDDREADVAGSGTFMASGWHPVYARLHYAQNTAGLET